MKVSEIHLFIIWEKALHKQAQIMADIESRFNIIGLYKIKWSDRYYSSNLTRFYGKKLPNGSFKEKECGRGPFLLVIVEDINPIYQMRLTSKGEDFVNIKTFDAKEVYRSWTGGGHKIHATNNIKETNHDLVLLLGQTIKEYNKVENPEVVDLDQDLIGANGWSSLSQLFYVLNNTCEYLVLRNFEEFPDRILLDQHLDVDLLCTDKDEVAFITNAHKVNHVKSRVNYHVKIDNKNIAFDLRYLGDNYYDFKWQKDLLKNRINSTKGFYRPNDKDYFYSLLYHALLHKKLYSQDYAARLSTLAKDYSLANPNLLLNADDASKVLAIYLESNGYAITEPKDLSVFINPEYYPFKFYTWLRKLKYWKFRKIN
jgi:hypothetical protein